MTRYDHDIDDRIISYLYENKKAYFSQILRQIGGSHKGISKKVLSSHLKKLEKDKIILREKARLGYPRFYYLTNLTIKQISLGIHVQVKTKRERKASALDRGNLEHPITKKKRMYHLLFYVASVGARRLKHDLEAEPGDIGVFGADGKLAAYSVYDIDGVGVSDFSVKPIGIIGEGGALTDVVADLTTSEISSLLEMLSSAKPKLIKPVSFADGEISYDIDNKALADYISDCWVLFSFVDWRMEETWNYIRKPTKDEVEWYVFLYGKRKTKDFFSKAQEIRNHSKTDTKKIEYTREHIRSWDNAIQHHLDGWRDEKGITTRHGIYEKYGKKVMKEYEFPAKVLLDIVYPKFLRNLLKRKEI